jgi:hypothetical protein
MAEPEGDLGYRHAFGKRGAGERVSADGPGVVAAYPSWANLVRSGSGLDGFDDPRDMVG